MTSLQPHSPQFGLFIHWGLYALKGWHEQETWRWPVNREEYGNYLHQFNPVHFDPEAWLDTAEAAGMDYVVFTTKHCDGFCNWNSQHTDFKITNTPYGKDVLTLLAEACQRRNMPLGLYYSIPDMHHPAYPHAGRPYEFAEPQPGDTADQAAYIDYIRAQAEELLTRYGPIAFWWWDANVMEYHDEDFHDFLRELQPGIEINNRGFGKGDFGTPERDWDDSVNTLDAFPEPTEACQSIGLYAWNWKADEDYYSDWHLQSSIAKIMAKGGNYLLNVGPQADGTFTPHDTALLKRLGDWFNSVKESFEKTVPCNGLSDNADVLLTRREDSLYVILNKTPVTNAVRLRPLGSTPLSTTLLNTGEPVDTIVNRLPGYGPGVDADPVLRLRNLPVNELAGEVLVIRLDFAAGELPDEVADKRGEEREYSAP
jgi:alpha-L-fucosidase